MTSTAAVSLDVMTRPPRSSEKALKRLQKTIRGPNGPGEPVDNAEIPPHLVDRFPAAKETGETLGLYANEKEALAEARRLLLSDLRFEHLNARDIQNRTWEFVCEAHLDREADLATRFMGEHSRQPADHTCYPPLELLEVTEAREFQGVTLLPRESVAPPAIEIGPDPRPLGGSVIAVEVHGVDYGKMRDRARAVAERAVRLLRISLRADRWVPPFQLRFRLGVHAWFDDGASTWQRDSEAGSVLTLDTGLMKYLDGEAIAGLPEKNPTELEQRVERALRWWDRAQLETDPVIATTFLFSALEAVLGQRGEGLKAGKLAVRRAMLGLLASGGFTSPDRTFLLYARVRSHAVHGEDVPSVDNDVVRRFSDDVRRALNEVLAYANDNNLKTRKALREALDQHERRAKVKASLRERSPKVWDKFFAKEEEEQEEDGESDGTEH